jgi:hypothetical protein
LNAPLLLGQICSRWRDIALSTPALWNSIRLGAWERLGLPLAKMPLIKAWLGRSGNLPLSIQIYHFEAATPTSSDFLDILIPFSPRWYKLDLWLSQSLAEKLVCNSELSIPSLTSLSLSLSASMERAKSLLFSPKATGLRKVTVLIEPLMPRFLNFPWAQITDFRSDSMIDIHDCYDIFRLCPQLIYLRLRNISVDRFTRENCDIVSMNQLSWLRLYSHGNVGPLLDLIEVPSLREIHLETMMDRMWPKSPLLAMLSRSSSPLEILTIQHTPRRTKITEMDIAECFESIQTLRDISVVDMFTTTLYRRRADQENSESGSGAYEQVSVSGGISELSGSWKSSLP